MKLYIIRNDICFWDMNKEICSFPDDSVIVLIDDNTTFRGLEHCMKFIGPNAEFLYLSHYLADKNALDRQQML